MKRHLTSLYLLCACLLSSCITNPVTGRKKVLGAIPVPFTGNNEPIDAQSPQALMIHQLEPLVYAAIILMIGGATIWKMTAGCTGLGKTFIALGGLFLLIATVMPQIAGWIGLITVLCVVSMVGYFAWMFLKRK